MTRQELEQLCQPQTPDEVLDGLRMLYNALEAQDETSDEEMDNIAAGVRVMEKLIEDIDMPATVQARRMIW